MKNIFRTVGMATLTLAFAGCNSDNLSLDDARHEQYVRNFIEAFGIPDPDHNYAMAKSAGLHVTTKVGGHVTVTAEVQGKEYLFADLDVTPGTHALPVTIPSSVKELIVTTNNGVQTVATDATVDIDQIAAGSRAGIYTVDDLDNDYDMKFVEDENGEYPYLVFNPEAFYYTGQGNTGTQEKIKTTIQRHFTSGKENTDYDYKWNTRDSKFSSAPHETVMTCINAQMEYYIFPIYWRKSNGTKDYTVYLHKVCDGQNDLKGKWRVPFNEESDVENGTPFPHLAYAETYNSNLSFKDLLSNINLENDTYNPGGGVGDTQFKHADANAEEAYPDGSKIVISRGIKVNLTHVDRKYYPSFAIAVECTNKDGSKSFSSSAPFYNGAFWGNNYYDAPLSNLYLANASTKSVTIPYMPLWINDNTIIDRVEKDIQYLTYKHPVGYYYKNTNDADKTADNKWSYVKNATYYPQLLGFSSAPTQPADKSMRDYADVIFIITPHLATQTAWSYQRTKLPDPYEWTLAAEDLGGSDDWDFNDVVFTFTDEIRNLKSANHLSTVAMLTGPNGAQSVRVISVTPKATGGTMPIYITFTGQHVQAMPDMPAGSENKTMPDENAVWFSQVNADLKAFLEREGQSGTFILGTEVHKWLGAPDYTTFVNVGENRQNVNARTVEFVIPTNLDLDENYQLDYTTSASKNNQPLYGFAVLVDKDNTLNIDTFNDEDKGFRFMPSLTVGEGTYLICAPSDDKNVKVAQMILVEGDWQWPTERTNIMDAYPNFKDWIQNQSNTEWIMNPNESKVTKK